MDLWSDAFTQTPGVSWHDTIPDDLKASLEDLADLIIEKGREPSSWAAAYRTIKERWPDNAPKQAETLRSTVRRLVEERRGG